METSYFNSLPPSRTNDGRKFIHPKYNYLECDLNGFLVSTDEHIALYVQNRKVNSFTYGNGYRIAPQRNRKSDKWREDNNIPLWRPFVLNKSKTLFECYHNVIVDSGRVIHMDWNFFNNSPNNLHLVAYPFKNKAIKARNLFIENSINDGLKLVKDKTIEEADLYFRVLMIHKDLRNRIIKKMKKLE